MKAILFQASIISVFVSASGASAFAVNQSPAAFWNEHKSGLVNGCGSDAEVTFEKLDPPKDSRYKTPELNEVRGTFADMISELSLAVVSDSDIGRANAKSLKDQLRAKLFICAENQITGPAYKSSTKNLVRRAMLLKRLSGLSENALETKKKMDCEKQKIILARSLDPELYYDDDTVDPRTARRYYMNCLINEVRADVFPEIYGLVKREVSLTDAPDRLRALNNASAEESYRNRQRLSDQGRKISYESMTEYQKIKAQEKIEKERQIKSAARAEALRREAAKREQRRIRDEAAAVGVGVTSAE